MAGEANAQKIREFNERASKQTQSAMGAAGTPPVQTVTPVVSPTATMSVADIQLLLADPSTLSQEQLLRRDALATKENLKHADDVKKQQESAARAQALAERNLRKVATGEIRNAVTSGMDATTPVGRWLESRPKPGGIATLLIIIAVFLLAIVPVNSNGDTRLKLIWLTLTGKTYIDYSQSGQAIQSSSQAEITSYQNSLPASQQPYVPPQNTQSIPNFTPGMANVVSNMFGLTNL